MSEARLIRTFVALKVNKLGRLGSYVACLILYGPRDGHRQFHAPAHAEERAEIDCRTSTENPMGDKGIDGTPAWAYDEDGYCVCCDNGHWKYHMPDCELRDALDAALRADLAGAGAAGEPEWITPAEDMWQDDDFAEPDD